VERRWFFGEDIDLSQAIRLGVIFVCLFEVYVNKIQIAELEHDAVHAAARGVKRG